MVSLKTAFAALLLATPFTWARPRCPARDERDWLTVWGTMPQLVEPANLPPAPFNETGRVFNDATLRQTVKLSLPSSALRLQISNAFGVNDIGAAANDPASQRAVGDRLPSAYDQIVTRLHRFGIAAFGATITPLTGTDQPYSDPEREKTRQRVNEWIRNSGRYDAVIDFDEMVRDPAAPEKLREDYDTGDHLHLNPAGYDAMAAGIDLSIFEEFKRRGPRGFDIRECG